MRNSCLGIAVVLSGFFFLPTARMQSQLRLVNCESTTTLTGQRFLVYTDKSLKGTSTIRLKKVQGANGQATAVEASGQITVDFPYGYAGLHLPLVKAIDDIFDVSKFNTVKLTVRGDGRTYQLILVTKAVKDYDYFTFPFKPEGSWTQVEVPFSKFHQVGFGAPVKWTGQDLQAIRIHIQSFGDPIPGYWFAIDNLELF